MKPPKMSLTIIEIFTLIVIIALIPVVITASLDTARDIAKIPLCQNQMKQLHFALVAFCADSNDAMPNVWDIDGHAETHPYALYRADKAEYRYPGGKLVPLRFACLYETGHLANPNILYCPANRDPRFMFKSYNNPPPWGSLPQAYNTEYQTNEWVRMGYYYLATDANYTEPPFPNPSGEFKHAENFSSLDPNIPYLVDVLAIPKDRISHNTGGKPGVNALYKNGSVVYCDSDEVFSHGYFDPSPGPGIPGPIPYFELFKLIGERCGSAD